MAEHVTGVWEARPPPYDAGLMGSRRLMALGDGRWSTRTRRTCSRRPPQQPHDPGFVPFVRRAQAAGIPVEVVSDGFGFFIEPALEALGVPGAPGRHRADDVSGDDRASIEFPNGHPRASCAGPASADASWPTRPRAGAVVFIGDGESDRYAAGYSDVVFAKRCARADLRRGRLAVPALDASSARSRPGWRRPSTPWRADSLAPLAGRSAAQPLLLRPGGLGRGPGGSAGGRLAAGGCVDLDERSRPECQSQRSQWANVLERHPASLEAR